MKLEVTRIKVYSNTAHPILKHRSSYTQLPLVVYMMSAATPVQPLFRKGSVPLRNLSNYT